MDREIEGFWKYNDLEIYYKIIGEGIPVIMFHGYYVDNIIMTTCMEPIFKNDLLNTNYKRIYFDLPGMGKTKHVEWLDNVDTLLDILIKFVLEITNKEPFLIVSESYGGYLARGICYKIPDLIKASIFICPCIYADFNFRTLPKFKYFRNDLESEELSNPDGFKNFERFMVIQNKKTWERYQNEILSGIKNANMDRIRAFRNNGYLFSFDVDKISHLYQFPSLFFAGKQDNRVGYVDIWGIIKNFENSSFFLLNNAGHYLQIDQEDWFNTITLKWLKNLET